MNSIMRLVKSRLLQHFEREADPQSSLSVLEKQIETLNIRLNNYQIEYNKLKERVDREFNNYNLEVQIKKVELDIKD